MQMPTDTRSSKKFQRMDAPREVHGNNVGPSDTSQSIPTREAGNMHTLRQSMNTLTQTADVRRKQLDRLPREYRSLVSGCGRR